MQKQPSRDQRDETFTNPDTRERWEWVRQAIDIAETSSIKALQARAEDPVTAAPSPFD